MRISRKLLIINQQAAEEVAAKNGAEALTDYQSLLGKVDAGHIGLNVVPTTLHHQVSKDFLNAVCACFSRKADTTVTVTVEEADE